MRQIVTLNGAQYDAQTGERVDDKPGFVKVENDRGHTVKKSVNHAGSVHGTTQRSQTLNRRTIQKPASHVVHGYRKQRVAQEVEKSPAISKFAPHPVVTPISRAVISDFRKPQTSTAKAAPAITPAPAKISTAIQEDKKPAAPSLSQSIKNQAIDNAMQQDAPKAKRVRNKAKRKASKWQPRFMTIASASLALILLGGYFTYINMPNLSVRVAAVQAGIDASYPQYKPDGYHLKGTVAYEPGQVNMKFSSSAGPYFEIEQAKSDWDSTALLENYVEENAGDNYTITNDRGLTIYSFAGKTVWVNGGIMYTISGDAPLSGDQIQRMVASL